MAQPKPRHVRPLGRIPRLGYKACRIRRPAGCPVPPHRRREHRLAGNHHEQSLLLPVCRRCAGGARPGRCKRSFGDRLPPNRRQIKVQWCQGLLGDASRWQRRRFRPACARREKSSPPRTTSTRPSRQPCGTLPFEPSETAWCHFPGYRPYLLRQKTGGMRSGPALILYQPPDQSLVVSFPVLLAAELALPQLGPKWQRLPAKQAAHNSLSSSFGVTELAV